MLYITHTHACYILHTHNTHIHIPNHIHAIYVIHYCYILLHNHINILDITTPDKHNIHTIDYAYIYYYILHISYIDTTHKHINSRLYHNNIC